MSEDQNALVALAKQIADKYGLNGNLVSALVEQESNWDPWAIRYEPGFFSRYVLPIGNIGHTEMTARATSWGLMQVMGQVAREQGFGGPFLSELCDPEVGLEMGCKYFSVLMGKTGNNIDQALLRWNGGSNRDYVTQVRNRIATYNV